MPINYRPTLGAAWVAAAGSPCYRIAAADTARLSHGPHIALGPHAAVAPTGGRLTAPTIAVRFPDA